MLLALVAVVPLTLDRVRLLEAGRAESIELARNDVAELTRRAVETQSEIINSTRAVLRVATRAYQTIDGNAADCAATLARLVTDVPWVTSMSVIGADNRVRCSTLPVMVGKDLSDRAFIRTARDTRGFVLSDYVIDRGNGAPTVIAARPIWRSDANELEVLAAPIDLQWIGRSSDAIARRTGAAALLLDGQGTAIAAVPMRDGLVGERLGDNPQLARILSTPEGQATVTWPDGVRRIAAFARLPGTDSRVLVGLDEREVLSRIDREIGIAYLQLAAFGLLVLLAAWFGGEQLIVQPIRSLARVATRIGRGELGARPTAQKWAAEFVPLVAALADMGNQLSAREHELRSANRHLEELASIDSLCGLANRRSFDAHLEAEWQRADLSGRPLGLLMIDVDHFKLFNDNYGHVEGDRCLQIVAELLNAVVDGDDFAARYGGEEFALLMPETDLKRAMATAERLRAEVAALAIIHTGAPRGIVTVSVGVACLVPGDDSPPQCLVEAADAGLYQAKRCGRNMVAAEAPALVPEAGDGAGPKRSRARAGTDIVDPDAAMMS